MEKMHSISETPQKPELISLGIITDRVKEQALIVSQNLSTIAQNIDAAKNYADFARIKNDINNFLIDMFGNFLEGKDSTFKLGFEQGNISKFVTQTDMEKFPLMELLYLKNKFYNEILRQIVALGKLDVIITPEEKEDILNMIDSWVFSFLDAIYLERYKQIYNGENDGITSEKLAYGGVKWGKVVSLKELSKNEIVIDDEKLSKIHNDNIRNYLLKFSEFIKNGITDYQTWVDAEIYEVKSWQDRENLFGLVAPMEDYMYPGVLVEPELLIFFRNIEKKVLLEDYYGLSDKYFWDKYGMNHMTLDFVETLIQTGDAAYSSFIGKAFPNDNELSLKEGNCIILRDTRMRMTVTNAKAAMIWLLGSDFAFDEEKLYNEIIKEVTYHEFGHSLFVKWHGGSLLEEAKATLFYYLQVFDENQNKAYTSEDITKVIEFAVMDSIRNLERINETSSKKYVILTKIILSALFDLDILTWNENGLLVIDNDAGKFNLFLENMKDDLLWIQRIYTHTDEQREKEELFYLDTLDAMVEKDVEKMIEVIKKQTRKRLFLLLVHNSTNFCFYSFFNIMLRFLSWNYECFVSQHSFFS